jgi:DNA-binding CsgD family transcriptional regulator
LIATLNLMRFTSPKLQTLMNINSGNDNQETTKISEREREMLQLAAQGLNTKESAEKMGIGIDTIESHRRNIFKKLGAKNITEAVSMGLRMGIIK